MDMLNKYLKKVDLKMVLLVLFAIIIYKMLFSGTYQEGMTNKGSPTEALEKQIEILKSEGNDIKEYYNKSIQSEYGSTNRELLENLILEADNYYNIVLPNAYIDTLVNKSTKKIKELEDAIKMKEMLPKITEMLEQV